MNNKIMWTLLPLALILSACGSSNKTYETIENNISIDEPYEVPGGTSIIVDGATDSMITSNIENNQYIIDCGGSCGDITIGIPVDEKG